MKARLLSGFLLASSAVAQTTIHDLGGPISAQYGRACDVVGDTDGDGLGELLVSAPYDGIGGLIWSGNAIVYSGANGGQLASIWGSRHSDRLGWGASAAGDVNGDGFADYCVATPLAAPDPGAVVVYSGRDGSVLHTFPGRRNTFFGWATAAIGDANGDGRDDLLVSATLEGSLTVFSGADGSVLQRVLGTAGLGGFGENVGRVGDVDGDGRADFAGVDLNTVRVFSGATGQELWRRGAGQREGTVSGGIDANGDGFDDFLVGAPVVNSDTGRVHLVSGRDGALLFEVLGTAPGDKLGAGVVGAGDLDGDGYGDFAAGLPGFDGAAGLDTGAVRAYSGRTGAVISTLEGDVAGDYLGHKLGGGRDVNGDGIPDVIASGIGKAKVISFVSRGLELFGTGTPGCRGTSTLLANGVPALGNSAFALQASATGATQLLLMGDSADTLGSLRFGARFHLDFAPPPPAVGLLRQRRLPDPDAHGSIVVPLPIPADPSLLGKTFVFQIASLFPSGACGQVLTTSRGLRLTIQ